jgi:hypothetical protein
MDKITETVNAYNLPTEESSAVKSLIYGFREGRFKVSELRDAADRRLTNSICCGKSGFGNYESRLDTVLEHFRRFNRENHV